MSFVRSSKFRHVFGSAYKKDKCYDNIRITKSPWESNMSDVNNKFVAVVLESQGGGAFLVAPITKTGRFDLNYPKVAGHTGLVQDLAWNPFDDNQIASSSEDCKVKLWRIPDEGLTSNMEKEAAEAELEGHNKKVGCISWHPTAASILASGSADGFVFIWNTETCEILFRMEPQDMVNSMAWNYNGSKMAVSCKKNMYVYDPRKNILLSEGSGHAGSKPTKLTFCGRTNLLFSTGFTRSSEREYALWNPDDLSKPLKKEEIDSGSGVITPVFDDGTNVVYLIGKGDTAIKYVEVVTDPPGIFFLSMYQSKDVKRGAACMPKRFLDHMQCEVMRFYTLQTKGLIEPISMTVPRKSGMFQEDIFPPCPAGVPALTAAEWAAGADKDPILVKITADGLGDQLSISAAPSKPRSYSKQNSQGSTSSGSSSRPRSVSPPVISAGATTAEADAQLTKDNQRLRSELHALQNENKQLVQQLKDKDDTIKKIKQLVN